MNPFLAKLRGQAAERDREWKLREEQDRAFPEYARSDAEHIDGRRQEQRAAEEAKQRPAEAQTCATQEKYKAEEARKLWRGTPDGLASLDPAGARRARAWFGRDGA